MIGEAPVLLALGVLGSIVYRYQITPLSYLGHTYFVLGDNFIGIVGALVIVLISFLSSLLWASLGHIVLGTNSRP